MTHEEKVTKVMQELKVSRKSAINTVHMLDWMIAQEEGLKEVWGWYKADTGDNEMPFNEFCYGLWPRCKRNYLSMKEAKS